MQVEFTPINASSKAITLTVEPERVDKYYQKYLQKAAKEVVVPGFRKGKAPLAMVERMYADRIEDYFMKDVVDDVFDEAAKEHDIHYLLYPEVKDIKWEKGTEMVIQIEIEIEPELEFQQIEGLNAPYQPALLEDEVNRYIDELRNENATMVDVETAGEGDEVECELSVELNGEMVVQTVKLTAGEQSPLRSLPELIGKSTGDALEPTISGRLLRFSLKDVEGIDIEQDYQVKLLVNSVLHSQIPALDDEFAKDMEFDDLEGMKAKIAEDMKLKNEHVNINIKNAAIISKLYVDNNFPLPMKTLEHIAQQQMKGIDDPQWRDYYLYQVRMQLAQEMINLYILNNLKRLMPVELTDADIDNYIIHQAILEDKTAEAFKEAHKSELETEDFAETVKNYTLLVRLANTATFFVPEPEAKPEEQIEAAQTVDQEEKATEEPKPKKTRSKKE
ncbi:MAG TPA: trigger factor [Candidatus Cloacimonadota bacterium]|nr:trigger factor [Candidatus Cloacimonadota bacterium]